MHKLVSNGTHLLKRSGHLVRTPIRISLQPDQRAFYSVANEYTGTQWPDKGFIAQGTVANCYTVGANLIQEYLNPTRALQMWRAVTTDHDPETAWYQGAYAPSAATMAQGYQSVEAYLQLGAYHFTVPQGLENLSVSSVTVKFVNGGAAQAYQSASVQSANNGQLNVYHDWNEWRIPVVCTQNLGTPSELANSPSDASVDILADIGTFRGARDLWGFTGTSRDGGIVTLSAPVQKSFTMGAGTLAAFNANKGGWIVPFVDAYYNGAQSYGPQYVNTNNGYWGCFSVWGVTLEIELD